MVFSLGDLKLQKVYHVHVVHVDSLTDISLVLYLYLHIYFRVLALEYGSEILIGMRAHHLEGTVVWQAYFVVVFDCISLLN